MIRSAGCALASVLLASVFSAVQAQAPVQGIYTCVDGKGRKLTADRPIAECLDREQKVLNPSGTVKATVAPALTAQERLDKEKRATAETQERARQAEERGRDRALLMRYPDKAMHDKGRAEALAQVEVVLRSTKLRLEELSRQRAALENEMEFYRKDPGKAPSTLRRQVDENTQSLTGQKQFIADQEAEIKRVNARFDEELVRLKQLWSPPVAPPVATSKTR